MEALEVEGKVQNALLKASHEMNALKAKAKVVEKTIVQAKAKVTKALRIIEVQWKKEL